MSELGAAFKRVVRAISRLRGRDTHLGPGELSHAQFELLIELEERGECSAAALASAARLTPATVTQLLGGLAASGHVERVRSASDGRVVISRLTPKGASAIEAKRVTWQGRWSAALADVPRDDIEAATRVLGRLAEMLEQSPPTACSEGVESPVQPGSQG